MTREGDEVPSTQDPESSHVAATDALTRSATMDSLPPQEPPRQDIEETLAAAVVSSVGVTQSNLHTIPRDLKLLRRTEAKDTERANTIALSKANTVALSEDSDLQETFPAKHSDLDALCLEFPKVFEGQPQQQRWFPAKHLDALWLEFPKMIESQPQQQRSFPASHSNLDALCLSSPEGIKAQPQHISKKGKCLFVLCDGTWNNAVGTKTAMTNVARLARCLQNRTEARKPQLIYYCSGVGTTGTWMSNLVQGAFGDGKFSNRPAFNQVC